MWKQITFGLTVLIITTNTLVNSQVTCTPPWKKVYRGCHMLNTQLSTWYEAQLVCQRNGGYLASMSSKAEAVRVLLNIHPLLRTASMKHWWLGLSLNKTIATWKWEDGTDLQTNVIAWIPGKPTALRDEQCGEMNIQGRLNDQKCDSLNPFICEQYPPTFSPPSKTTVATTTKDPEIVVPNSTTINPVHTAVKTNKADINVEKPQCDPLEEYDTSWPSVSKGEVVSCPCKTGTGFATWTCDEETSEWKVIPNIDDCPRVLKDIERILDQTMSTSEDVSQLTADLVDALQAGGGRTVTDIVTTARVLKSIPEEFRTVAQLPCSTFWTPPLSPVPDIKLHDPIPSASILCFDVKQRYQQVSLQGERNSIHNNLVFCLFVAEAVFVSGIEKTKQKVACAAIALLMHFFNLSAFTWMFLEEIHIDRFMLVQVFDAAKSRLK